MARWRLDIGHYLFTDPPAEIEFKETDRETGRQARKVYKVPRCLEPKDPSDHNYPGEIIVSDGKGNFQPRDIVFFGDPTMDMTPIDDEAKKISQTFIDSGRWTKKEEGLDFGESLIKNFMEKINTLQFGPTPQPVSTNGIDPKDFSDLKDQVKALIEQNAKLQAQIAEKPLRRA